MRGVGNFAEKFIHLCGRSKQLDFYIYTIRAMKRKLLSIMMLGIALLVSATTTNGSEAELRECLAKLYHDTNGKNWKNKRNWCTNVPVAKWYGVTRDSNGLYSIDLMNNNLVGEVDISRCDLIKSLNLQGNNVKGVLNVSKCKNLELLRCPGTQVTHIDASDCPRLKVPVFCLTDFARFTPIESIDFSRCISIDEFVLRDMKILKSLNFTGCTGLKTLLCDGNKLVELNLSGCSSLEILDCKNNDIASLNVSSCTSLTHLCIEGTRITSIDLSSNTELFNVHATNTPLAAIDISKNPKLTRASCAHMKVTPTLKVVRLTSKQMGCVYAWGWGTQDDKVYKYPQHVGGFQYPAYVIVD